MQYTVDYKITQATKYQFTLLLNYFRCSRNVDCGAYQYSKSGPDNCILIHRNSTDENGNTFFHTLQTELFKKGLYSVFGGGGSMHISN